MSMSKTDEKKAEFIESIERGGRCPFCAAKIEHKFAQYRCKGCGFEVRYWVRT